MAKRSCRRTTDENLIHKKAVEMRKKTDEQLVHYVEDRVEKARSEGYVSKQKKSVAEMCNVPEENVIPISRLEYEAYTDE